MENQRNVLNHQPDKVLSEEKQTTDGYSETLCPLPSDTDVRLLANPLNGPIKAG